MLDPSVLVFFHKWLNENKVDLSLSYRVTKLINSGIKK